MATIIYNNLIPLKGYIAITLWPFIFARHELSETIIRHERIHGAQQKEMLLLPFYLWYGLEYLLRLCQYRNISFEREAYANEHDKNYLASRKHYSWLKYL